MLCFFFFSLRIADSREQYVYNNNREGTAKEKTELFLSLLPSPPPPPEDPPERVCARVYNIHAQRQRVINIPEHRSDKRSFPNTKARIKKKYIYVCIPKKKKTPMLYYGDARRKSTAPRIMYVVCTR